MYVFGRYLSCSARDTADLLVLTMPVDVAAAGVDMLLASRSGDVRVVRSLVQRPGTDMEARDILGDTAILKAARYGHREVCWQEV